jgi:hypothetical protein
LAWRSPRSATTVRPRPRAGTQRTTLPGCGVPSTLFGAVGSHRSRSLRRHPGRRARSRARPFWLAVHLDFELA